MLEARGLAKSFGALGSTIADMHKRIDQIAADVEYLQNLTPNSSIRRIHS